MHKYNMTLISKVIELVIHRPNLFLISNYDLKKAKTRHMHKRNEDMNIVKCVISKPISRNRYDSVQNETYKLKGPTGSYKLFLSKLIDKLWKLCFFC